MPIVLLVRHGENDYVKKGRLAGRLPGVRLNEKGRQQAAMLAEKLKEAPIKAIYSSPLERTMETAAPMADVLKLEVVPRAGLLEVDFGEWQDKTLKSLRRLKLWKTVQGTPSLMRFPGGETFADAQHRVVNELLYLCAKHEPKDLFVCVSHSDLIKLAVAYFIGLPLDNFQRLHAGPGSINTLMISEQGSSLLGLNVDLSFTFRQE
jgi:probable phosphomutase (TIGR03848 family)